MQVSISRRIILWGIALLIGIAFLCKGISEIIRYDNAADFNELKAEQCRSGRYVVGEISDYLTIPLPNSASGSRSGVSNEVMTLGTVYSVYTVPIAENQYIRIMAADPDTKRLLGTSGLPEGVKVHFEGEVIPSPIELNEDWYHNGLSDFDTDRIIGDFVVREAVIHTKGRMMYGGLIILGTCIVLLFTGALKGSIKKESRDPYQEYIEQKFAHLKKIKENEEE